MPVSQIRFIARRASVIACLLLIVPGCRSDDDGALPEYSPTFTATDCPIPIADPDIACGVVRLPENRNDPNGRAVELAVARLAALGGEADAIPLLYINGGPGSASLPSLGTFAESGLRRDRELILFDARGTGFSLPSLECPEREEATWFNFSRSERAAVEVLEVVGATVECAQRLRADGIDLDSYDTLSNAADVADLRIALGIDEWFLLGRSYGSTVALEVMRQHPEGVRGVALDAVYPLGEGRSLTRVIETGGRSFERLFEMCDSDPACRASAGDLRSLMDATLRQYDEVPYVTEIFDERSGVRRPVVIDGADLLAGLFDALYDSSLIPSIPGLFQAVAARNSVVIDELARLGINAVNQLAEGVFAAVECRDRGRDWRLDDVLVVLEERPEFKTVYNSSVVTAACEALGLGSIPAELEAPVESDIPTLLFGGGFDPIVPPQWGVTAAASLVNGKSLVFAAGGHGVIGFSDCSFEVLLEFFRDPATAATADCPGLLAP